MSGEELEDSLVGAIAKSDAADLLTDVAEFSLDQLLDEGFAKDIPVFGTLVKLYKAGVGVRGYLFAKKLQRFLSNLAEVPAEERAAFGDRLEQDQDLRQRVGENLVLILDRLDDMAKPELTARAFRAFIREDFDFFTLQRLWAAIDRCLVFDLRRLQGFDQPARFEAHVAQILLSAGLLEISSVPSVRGPGAENLYRRTSLGDLFVQVVIENRERDD